MLDTALLTQFVRRKNNFSRTSARSVRRRIENMSLDIKEKLKSKKENFEYFSLVLDESTDIHDTAQLAIFVRGIKNVEILEKLVKWEPLKGMMTGRDVLNDFLRATVEMNLDLCKLISITTDGAPAVVGRMALLVFWSII